MSVNAAITDIMFSFWKKLIGNFPYNTLSFNNELPRPINKLKNGPPIQPDNAISPYPFLTKRVFNTKSGKLFPNVNTVIPRNVSGMFINKPIVFNKAIKLSAINHIHIIDIIKVMKDMSNG